MRSKNETDLINLGSSGGGFFAGKVFTTLANVVSILSWIGLGGTVFYAVLSKIWVWLVLCLVPIAFIFIIAYAKKHKSQIMSRFMRWLAPAMPYMINNWNVVYEYVNSTQMRFEATYLVKALQVGVDYIIVRYNWSGENADNKIIPKVISDRDGFESSRLEFVGTEYGYSYYKLYSLRTHNKGDVFKLGVQIEDMNVKGKDPSPHLLTSVIAVTEMLSMSVVFPANIYPNKVVCMEYINSTDFYYWQSKRIEAKRNEDKWIISHNQKNPIYGGKYVIEWEPQYTTVPANSSNKELESVAN